MLFAAEFHKVIESYNVLQKPTKIANEFLQENPTLYKAAILANHLFRAVSMALLLQALPFSPLANGAICLASSVFYRLTVENNCAYKFALPAFAGALVLPSTYSALTGLISGIAHVSLNTFGAACASALPLAAYFTYIALTVSYDVDRRCGILETSLAKFDLILK